MPENESVDPIEARLRAAQAAMTTADEILRERRAAVAAAREAGWSKYKIAATLGVKGPTVDSIVRAIEREAAS